MLIVLGPDLERSVLGEKQPSYILPIISDPSESGTKCYQRKKQQPKNLDWNLWTNMVYESQMFGPRFNKLSCKAQIPSQTANCHLLKVGGWKIASQRLISSWFPREAAKGSRFFPSRPDSSLLPEPQHWSVLLTSSADHRRSSATPASLSFSSSESWPGRGKKKSTSRPDA